MPFDAQKQAVDPKASAGGDAASRGMQDPRVALPFRAEMERAFGCSFGAVVAHAGPNATAANTELGSKAFTFGEHVVLGSPNPERTLIAHELAHVVQQGAVTAPSAPDAPAPTSLEEEADNAATSVQQGQPVAIAGRGPAEVQAWKGNEHRAIGDAAWGSVQQDYQGNSALAGLMGDAEQAVGVRKKQGGKRTKQRIGYGEAGRRAGDHAFTVKQLENNVGEKGTDDPHKRGGLAPHTVALAKREWRAFHKAALKAAARSAAATDQQQRKAEFDEAIRQEAFGSHFLQDAFCSGHQTMKDLSRQTGTHGAKKSKADRMGNQRYHDWFNDNGLGLTSEVADEQQSADPAQPLQTHTESYQAYGDGALKKAAESGYDKLVVTAVEQSLRQVIEVATGEVDYKDALGRISEVASLIPHMDADKLERTRAGQPGWIHAAVVETLVGGYQKIHDNTKGAGKQKKTQSGTAIKGKQLRAGETMTDLFDGEFAGRDGKAADRHRIIRDLEFLAATLEEHWQGSGGEKERGRLARELVSTLGVRIVQFKAHVKGTAPDWLRALEAKVHGAWKRRVAAGAAKDAGKRAAWRGHVLALMKTIPGAGSAG